ncbi:hypothetical protein CXJ71_000948 [Escherichia coli]|nr:hypothetical protein [Escherichia coli]EFA7493652.1 hypothetical protein [Escherichia coli]
MSDKSPHQHEISSIHPWMINYSCAIPLNEATIPALDKRLNSSLPIASRIADQQSDMVKKIVFDTLKELYKKDSS